jgi:hypothetical protein
MGGVNNRPAKPTQPFDSQKLARLNEEMVSASVAEPFDDEADNAFDELSLELADQPASHPHVVAQPAAPASRLAQGTTPPRGTPQIETEPDPAIDLRSRTATIHDPLTTSLLAEVARRAQTVDLPPPADRDDDATKRKKPR